MRAILEKQVEEYLHPKAGLLPRLRFPPALEARFELARLESRSRQLTFTGSVALVCYDAFFFTDYAKHHILFWRSFVLRILVFTPCVFVTSWFVRRRARAAIRESLVLLTVTAAGAIVLGINYNLSYNDSIFSQTGFVLVLFFGSLILRQQFAYTAATSLLLVFADCIYLAADHWMTVEDKIIALFIAMTCAVLTVVANFMMERQERTSFAHFLKAGFHSKALAELNQKLTALSQVDGLTGLSNRRHFDERFEATWHEASEAGGWLSLVMIDIDHFKKLNDTFGHIAGDRVLVQVGQILGACVRTGDDVVGRFGGEEFILLLTGARHEEAHGIAEELRHLVSTSALAMNEAEETPWPVTVSCGLATVVPAPGDDRLQLIGEADLALYAAKRGGRNRVSCRLCEAVVPDQRRQTGAVDRTATNLQVQ